MSHSPRSTEWIESVAFSLTQVHY